MGGKGPTMTHNEEGGNMTEKEPLKDTKRGPLWKYAERSFKATGEETKAQTETMRALAANALGIDLEGVPYREAAKLIEWIDAPLSTESSTEERRAQIFAAKDEHRYLQGLASASTPERAIWYFPAIVNMTTGPLIDLITADEHHNIFTRLDRPRQWKDGKIGPPEWEVSPWEDIALHAALRWLEETQGRLNPFSTKQRNRLEELALEHLNALAELSGITPLDAPPPVDVPPLISNTKVGRDPKALTQTTAVGPGKRKQVANIPPSQVITRRIDGEPVRYTATHAAIGDAITAIVQERIAGAKWGEGVPVSNHEIARHLLQTKGKITPAQVAEVEEAIADLRMTHGRIEGTDYKRNNFRLEGPLLHADYLYLRQRNGTEVTGWKVYAYPLTNQYAGRLKQLRQVDNMLAGSKPRFLKRAVLERQVAAMVLLWHGTGFLGPEHPYQINYDTMIEKLGEAQEQERPLSRDQIRKRQQWIDAAVSHLQARGFITSWGHYYTEMKKTGVTMFLPPELPPASLVQFRPLEVEQD